MSEHHVQAGQLNEAEEVFDMVLPSGNEATEVMHPGEESFHLPAPAIAAQWASVLRLSLSIASVRADQFDAAPFEAFAQRIACRSPCRR